MKKRSFRPFRVFRNFRSNMFQLYYKSMKNNILYKLRSGKPPKFIYYGTNLFEWLLPAWFYRLRLKKELACLAGRSDKSYVEKRVDYYNKLASVVELPASLAGFDARKMPKKQKVYFFDTYRYTRWFPPVVKWGYCPGDVTFVPDCPSLVKSRPIAGDNAYSILLKLDKIRHFIFLDDPLPYEAKQDRLVFRGKVNGKPGRRRFMEMYFGHPMCDLGDVSRHTGDPQAWQTEKKTLREHLNYKFILALEGNDVASNLKWVMSSNSIAVMPPPTYETWFMEGTLIPDYHYIAIRPDFSDLEERLRYYIAHPGEARRIIEHAHAYVAQFRDEKREKLISLLVLDKYRAMTGQTAYAGEYKPAF